MITMTLLLLFTIKPVPETAPMFIKPLHTPNSVRVQRYKPQPAPVITGDKYTIDECTPQRY